MENSKFTTTLNGKELHIENKNLAELANGNVQVRYGDTVILVTACMSKSERNVDFFPLTVDYEEKYYAAGKILGGRYMRREGRPSDEAILTSRLIDRAIRPRFPKDFYKEVQVIATCLSWDKENDPDVLGLLGASTALTISDIPWGGPIAVLRVGRVEGKFIINPTYEEREKGDIDLVLAGMEKDNEVLLNMIEAGAQEVAEEAILEAYKFAEPELKKIIDFQKEIREKIGKEKAPIEEPFHDPGLEKEIKSFLEEKLEQSIFQGDKTGRMQEANQLKHELVSFVEEKYSDKADLGDRIKYAKDFFEKEVDRLIHEKAIKEEKRTDGREMDEVRDISCQVDLLPRTHGSGLFQRGQTKTLSILTLGAPGDVKLLEGMEIVGKKRFMHHYNFPPYSVGEVKPLRGPSRRDIGHGMLAEKALLPLIPSFEEFPYTIRIVSEILSSNGSTSMASCSSASLSLMDAGVPIKSPVTGIAVGLMQNEEKEYKLLADIQGPEDHHGDMDFKAAGTQKGITAIQMDVKIEGITGQIFKEALELGKKSRLSILEEITKTIQKPREKVSELAPKIIILQINPDKIREVIGPGGKMINEIIEETGVDIDIEDTGQVFITAEKEEAAQKAVEWIKNITREVKVGEVFQGKVKRILDFGAFVEIFPGTQGLIHISQLAGHHVKKVEDVVKIDQIVPAKVISIDEQGRINLSLKEAQKQGEK